MQRVAILLICAWLGACASPPAPPPVSGLLHDTLVAPTTQLVDAGQIFAMSPAMIQYANSELAHTTHLREPRRHLVDALYHRGKLRLSYDAGATRSAAEAFEDRAGNCLSLVIMTATFARQLGLPVSFQAVQTDDFYSRSGGLYMASGHVNLVLGPPAAHSGYSQGRRESLTIDFIPQDE